VVGRLHLGDPGLAGSQAPRERVLRQAKFFAPLAQAGGQGEFGLDQPDFFIAQAEKIARSERVSEGADQPRSGRLISVTDAQITQR
jgi:hypothetical protein